MNTTALIEQLVTRAKAEITADIESGKLPADIADFSDLHDYVDANCYGGLCDDDSPVGYDDESVQTVIVPFQDAIHEWLAGGRQ